MTDDSGVTHGSCRAKEESRVLVTMLQVLGQHQALRLVLSLHESVCSRSMTTAALCHSLSEDPNPHRQDTTVEPWRIRARRRRSFGSAIWKIERRGMAGHFTGVVRSRASLGQCGFESLEWTALVEGLRPNKFGGFADFHGWQFFAGCRTPFLRSRYPCQVLRSLPFLLHGLPPQLFRTCRCRPLNLRGHHRSACPRAGVLGSRGFSVESAGVWREAGAQAFCQGFGPACRPSRCSSVEVIADCLRERPSLLSVSLLRADVNAPVRTGSHCREVHRVEFSWVAGPREIGQLAAEVGGRWSISLLVRAKVRTLPHLERPCAPGLAVSVKCCPVLCHRTGVFALPWWIMQTWSTMATPPRSRLVVSEVPCLWPHL